MLDYINNKPHKIFLADDSEVFVRFFTEADSELLFDFYRNLPEEDRLTLKDDVTNRRIFRELVDRIHKGITTMILAFHEGNIVGEATLHRNLHGWTKHVGELRAVILREYSGLGLTRALLKAQVEVANAKGLDKVVFRILDNQKDSKKALEEVGFVQEAVLARHAMDLHGNLHDVIIMSNFVAELWRKMEDLIKDTEFEMIP
jgi:L-amino acid N-acyltransferase YncA